MKLLSIRVSTTLLLIFLTVFRNEIGTFVLDQLGIAFRPPLDRSGPQIVWFGLVVITLLVSFLASENLNYKHIGWAVFVFGLALITGDSFGGEFLRTTNFRTEIGWDVPILAFFLTMVFYTCVLAVLVMSINFYFNMEAKKYAEQGDYDSIYRLATLSRNMIPAGGATLEGYRLLGLTMQGRFDEVNNSTAQLKDISRKSRTHSIVQFCQWRMHNALGNTQIALDHFRRLMKTGDFNSVQQTEAIEAMIELGYTSRALETCKKLYKDGTSLSELAEAEALAAWAYASNGDRDKMHDLINSALPRLEHTSADSITSDVHYRVGRAFESVHDYQSADRHFRLSRDVMPDGIRGIRANSSLRRLDEVRRYKSVSQI